MDTILKWDFMQIACNYHNNEDRKKIQDLCQKGWEPVGAIRDELILKRPCGEIAITKHPELWQSPNQNSGIEY